MTAVSSAQHRAVRFPLLARFFNGFLTSPTAEDPRRRKRFGGYRVALDDKSIAIYGYDKRRLNQISATLNLY